MSGNGESGKGRIEDADALRAAVSEVGRDLKLLASRVAELSEAVESLGSDGAAPARGRQTARTTQASRVARSRVESMTVVVRPLPELAMAAMAETSLRGLPGVNQVVSVERFEDWARFTLEVVKGTDLVSEMKKALPVAFKSEQSDSGEISLVLKWAWGTAN